MEELIRPLEGITPMWMIVCIETLVIILAMSVDFAAGYHKAKLRGEERNSLGLKRTVSKFILYIGSVLIASGVDLIFYVCGFWKVIHFSALSTVPVVTSAVSIFICVIEIRSVWEKAEKKHQQEALQAAKAIVKLMNKDSIGERLEEVLENVKDAKNEEE
jgi:hypothetical protein